ncbi:MAG: Asp-tRNA(Asn)/Glu-tRNA(Gln) amidotransferase subunit GatA [Peptostreptococcaceae bacterium]|nr:Asp-tRNA(Asn)/Glu-tRNA(Gln) amidotransferase subunit GatA [Peptostreptococcaceae bacterium]
MDRKKIIKMSVRQIRRAVRERELSCEEIARTYLEEIGEKDGKIGAYLYVSEKVMEEARTLDDRIEKGEDPGRLCGVPVALKDNICTKQMPTTCASKMLEGYYSPFDAAVVEELKKEGALLLGKLNMDEFAMGSTTETSYFQKTSNPCDLSRVPGGSSGGSAAAVASKQTLMSLGSDTGGSIRQPAGFCGIVGLKPTYGSISRRGLIAFASSLDQIGPMGRRVEDVAEMLEVISRYDPQDSTSLDFARPSYTRALQTEIRGKKIALPRSFFGEGLSKEVSSAVHAAAENMAKLGGEIVEPQMKDMQYALPAYYILSSAEAASNLSRFDSIRYGWRAEGYEDMDGLYEKTRAEGFGKEVKRRILAGTYALSAGYYDAYYKKAQKIRSRIKEEYARLFQSCDLILSPVSPTTAYPFGQAQQDPIRAYLADIYTVPVNIAGLPALSMNCGYDSEGLPIGMQLIGDLFSEESILALAHQYETAFAR